MTIADEFSDMELSGSLDETARPGLLKLLSALRDPARKWNVLLAVDTSRIAYRAGTKGRRVNAP